MLEVLVVIAVIALLLAILTPSLREVRSQGKRALCQSNLKQLTTAWHSFLTVNKGLLPRYVNVNKTYGGIQGTSSSTLRYPTAKHPLNRHLNLAPWVKEAEVFHCPLDRGTEFRIGPVTNTIKNCYREEGTSYYTNDLLIGQAQRSELSADPCLQVIKKYNLKMETAVTTKVLNVAQLSNESRLVLMGDATWWHTFDWAKPTVCMQWHERKHFQNIAFMDGHVSFIQIKKGLLVTPQYVIMPFRELQDDAQAAQVEVACP